MPGCFLHHVQQLPHDRLSECLTSCPAADAGGQPGVQAAGGHRAGQLQGVPRAAAGRGRQQPGAVKCSCCFMKRHKVLESICCWHKSPAVPPHWPVVRGTPLGDLMSQCTTFCKPRNRTRLADRPFLCMQDAAQDVAACQLALAVALAGLLGDATPRHIAELGRGWLQQALAAFPWLRWQCALTKRLAEVWDAQAADARTAGARGKTQPDMLAATMLRQVLRLPYLHVLWCLCMCPT